MDFVLVTIILYIALGVCILSLPINFYWSIHGPPQFWALFWAKIWQWIWSRYGKNLEDWAHGRERSPGVVERRRRRGGRDRNGGDGVEEIELGEMEMGQTGVLRGEKDSGWRRFS
ncbi:hypothetical protein P154DRAFT_538867 [Amniculicola lignicola CBS 123094]|uniref:Uncharacterized protein n=1 Tax=Amniculicola lignicola CBS 123094 TaxID=1392246 RepID=A0A6A5W0S7_9PLEO|nr:hypothetical protein P154DRAFT_538867 [Amniculicola lignicola CBS 123094]